LFHAPHVIPYCSFRLKESIALVSLCRTACPALLFNTFISRQSDIAVMRKVTVYSTENCPYCRMAKTFLEKHGVPYESIDVGKDVEQAKKMVALSGQHGVPVITVDDEVIVGFDIRRLNELFGTATEEETYDVLIVGAGPAGLTAGVYCARKILKTVIISENIGGQALASWMIENYMGYRMVTGDELMKKFEEQAREHHIHLELDRITGVSRNEGLFSFSTTTERTFRAKAVIFAQGNRPRTLGVPDEERFLGRGLSLCSTCDGPLYRGKRVAVVGGGNSGLQTALEMGGIATSVSLIVRSSIRADEVYTGLLKKKGNIVVHLNSQVKALHGDTFLTGITVVSSATGAEQKIDVDGLFVEIGWMPNTDFLEGFLGLNDRKEIIVDINCHTSQPGAFAAGDVTSIRGKQIIIASGEGAKAALEAHEFVMKLPSA
jgi:alkyl hydroperoxide reductase subunit F